MEILKFLSGFEKSIPPPQKKLITVNRVPKAHSGFRRITGIKKLKALPSVTIAGQNEKKRVKREKQKRLSSPVR
jgi:hypothetical protein